MIGTDLKNISQSDEKLHVLFELLPVGVSLLDTNHNISDMNPALEQILDITHANLQKGAYSKRTYLKSDNTQMSYDEFPSTRAIQEQKIIKDVEVQVIKEDGSSIWVNVSAAPVHTDNATCVIVTTDITDRKKLEVNLAETSLRMKHIIDCTYVGTWEWNIQTGEMIINERWAEIIGYTLEELAPISIKTWESFAHPDDLEQSSKLLEAHFEGRQTNYEFECRMKHKKGHWIWVIDRGQVISKTPDGKPLMMFGTHSDISERKNSEALLKIISEQNKIISEQSPIAIELYDLNGLLIQANPSCLELFGIVDVNEIVKFSLFDDPNISEQRKSDIKQGKNIHYEASFDFNKVKELHLYKTSRSGQILLDIIISPTKEDGMVTGYLFQIQDITKRIEAEVIIQKKLEELKHMNDLMIGRELKMIELKKEIEALKKITN